MGYLSMSWSLIWTGTIRNQARGDGPVGHGTDSFSVSGRLARLSENEGCHVTLNLHPADGVAPFEEKYQAVARDLGKNPDSKDTIPWVNSDKRLIKAVFDNILTPMENMGVDFWWLDWQQYLYDPAIKGLSNTWWINYAFSATWNALPRKDQCFIIVGGE